MKNWLFERPKRLGRCRTVDSGKGRPKGWVGSGNAKGRPGLNYKKMLHTWKESCNGDSMLPVIACDKVARETIFS